MVRNKLYIFLIPCVVLLTFLLFAGSVKAQIEITDSHGKYRFSEPPKRVVVLNWALAEQMLELGETPVGMADIEGYNKHGGLPVIPQEVTDVGKRLSPNIRLIKNLKPDVILIGYSQRSLLRPLSNIATVIYFKNFGKRYDNHKKSEERFLELAKLFNKTETATQKLSARMARIKQLREQLLQAYRQNELPTLQLLVPNMADVTDQELNGQQWLFNRNSMPYYAATELGLSVMEIGEADQFGVTKLSYQVLKDKSDEIDSPICRLYFTRYSQMSKLPVEEGCAHILSYQNAFGGVMSIQYLAESITSALLKR